MLDGNRILSKDEILGSKLDRNGDGPNTNVLTAALSFQADLRVTA